MATEQGYSNQKKKGKAQFKTIHSSGSDSYSEQVIPKYLSDLVVPPVTSFISTITDILGLDGQVEFWEIAFIDPHYAIKGDVYRIKGSADDLFNFEFEIVSVVDANTIRVLPISGVKPTSLDFGTIKRWVTANSDDDGNPKVSLTPAPINFLLDGNLTEVSEDTATPANNIPLPVKLLNSDLSSTKDSVTIGDVNGDTAVTVSSNTNTIRSLAVSDDDGNDFLNQINNKTIENGFIDYDNAWSTPLLANETFTGLAFNVTNYAAINVCVVADVPSATNGLKVELSIDGTTWDHSHATTYAGGNGSGYIFNAEFKFARVVYINGATPQTAFKLLTIFKAMPVKQSLYTIDQAVNGNMFAELGKNVIIGKTTGGGGGFVDVKVTPSGALTTESVVSGSVSITGSVAVTGPLTNTELRAVAVPISGTVSTGLTQPLTDSQLRAAAVPISAVSLPLPSGASTLAEQQNQSTTLNNIDSNTNTISLAVQTETSAFTSASMVASGIDPTGSTVRALRVNSSNQLLTFIGNSSVVIQQSSQSGPITQTQKSVGLTAVRATVSGSAPLSSRKKVMFKPSKNNTGSIYLGSSSVTIASGMEIIGPDRLEFTFDSSDYYLISDVAGQVVEIIEVA